MTKEAVSRLELLTTIRSWRSTSNVTEVSPTLGIAIPLMNYCKEHGFLLNSQVISKPVPALKFTKLQVFQITLINTCEDLAWLLLLM
jgi:hypothetical protein